MAGYETSSFVVPFTLAGALSTGAGPIVFVAPTEIDILGVVASVGTAPSASTGLVLNFNITQFLFGTTVSLYATPAAGGVDNRPTIAKNATFSQAIYTQSPAVVANVPYALNDYFPGVPGTVGQLTAQSTGTVTLENTLTAPTYNRTYMAPPAAPDNVVTAADVNAIEPLTGFLYAGDILTLEIVDGSGSNLTGSILMQQHAQPVPHP